MTKQEQTILTKGESKLVSAVFASRGRFSLLLESLESLYDKARNPEQIQAIVRFDNDDTENLNNISNLPFDKINIRVIIGPRFRGYQDMHIFINECCSLACGDFLLNWNDDATMLTENWDSELEKYKCQTIVLNPNTHDDAQGINTFPIISRDIYDTLGHWSLQAHVDTWVSTLGQGLGIEKPIDIAIFHNRPDNPNCTRREEFMNDPVWQNRQKTFPISRPEFDEEKFNKLRHEDLVKLTNIVR